MSWVRIDDSFAFASTTVAAGNRAVGALVRMMAWAAEDGSDGFVPSSIVQVIASNSDVARLVASGLAEHVAAGEVRVVSGRSGRRPDVEVVMPGPGLFLATFLVTNLSRDEAAVLAERARKGGEASGRSRRGELEVQPQDELVDEPNRTEPNRTEKTLRSLGGPGGRNGDEPYDRDALDSHATMRRATAPTRKANALPREDRSADDLTVAAHDGGKISAGSLPSNSGAA